MKNVIAYSLWGDGPMYWVGALENISSVSKLFPGWICRFYIDNSCREDLISTIVGDNVEVIMVDSKDAFHGMFWRFWSADDEDVDIFLSRDCDCRFSNREVAAILEWLKSDKDFHIMRDHPFHTVPILGGLWGCRNGILRNIDLESKIESWNTFAIKGCDQDFLGQIIYPLVRDRAFEHSGYRMGFGNHVHPFPTKRIGTEYVGDIFDENNVRHPEHWKIMSQYTQYEL